MQNWGSVWNEGIRDLQGKERHTDDGFNQPLFSKAIIAGGFLCPRSHQTRNLNAFHTALLSQFEKCRTVIG